MIERRSCSLGNLAGYAALAAAAKCALLLHGGGALAAGTIPTAGGYSDTHNRVSAFTTVGIVIQVAGNAFKVSASQAGAESVEPGKGILTGDKMWVEHGGIVHLSDVAGSKIVVAGPAAVEFSKTIRVLSGSVRLHSAESGSVRFTSTQVAGEIRGEAALWVSEASSQLLALSGSVRAWHPKLQNSIVGVPPGFFTESARSANYLQPRKPVKSDVEKFVGFLVRFDPLEKPQYPQASEGRAVASVSEVERGSRSAEQVLEVKDRKALEVIQARMWGKDFEEPADAPLTPSSKRKH